MFQTIPASFALLSMIKGRRSMVADSGLVLFVIVCGKVDFIPIPHWCEKCNCCCSTSSRSVNIFQPKAMMNFDSLIETLSNFSTLYLLDAAISLLNALSYIPISWKSPENTL
jgi:hypothetical protein